MALALVLLFFPQIHADTLPVVRAVVDKHEARIGDPIVLTLSLHRPMESEIQPPDEKFFEDFELKDFKIFEEPAKKGEVQTILKYTLIPFQTGDFELGPMSLAYQDAWGQANELRTQELTIRVASLVGKDAKLPDIRGPKPPLEIERDLSWAVLLLALAFLLGLGAWVFARRIRLAEARKLTRAEPALSPRREALKALDALAQSMALKEGKTKEVYSALSNILKRYFGRQFGFDALDLTTFEFLREARKFGLSSEMFERVQSLFQESDIVKFARYMPDRSEPPRDIERAKEAVSLGEVTHAV